MLPRFGPVVAARFFTLPAKLCLFLWPMGRSRSRDKSARTRSPKKYRSPTPDRWSSSSHKKREWESGEWKSRDWQESRTPSRLPIESPRDRKQPVFKGPETWKSDQDFHDTVKAYKLDFPKIIATSDFTTKQRVAGMRIEDVKLWQLCYHQEDN